MIMKGVSSVGPASLHARKVLWILIIPEGDTVCIINMDNRFFLSISGRQKSGAGLPTLNYFMKITLRNYPFIEYKVDDEKSDRSIRVGNFPNLQYIPMPSI